MRVNKMPLAMAAMFVSVAVASAISGCGGQEIKKPDSSKTTYVKLLHYDAGYGRTYLEKTARAFEALVKDVSYEEGKKGVYIDIENSQMESTGQSLINSLPNSPYDIYATAGVTPADMKSSGQIMDVSAVMNSSSKDENPVSPFLNETSIYDRMYPEMQDYFSNTDGTIYGAPIFMMTTNLFYDVELVENRGLYIKEGSTDTELQFTKNLAQAQKGVDGKAGTADDGMPETWDQFYLWLVKIESLNITPIHYSGLYQQHFDWAMQQFWADFEGKENVKACWSFDGTKMTDLIDSIDENGNVTYLPETAITVENGYMVQKQEGRYRVMQLMKKLADSTKGSDKLIHNYAFSGSENHTEAQGTYISSKYTNKPIMLFAEGSYWETEATDKFEAYENRKGGKLDRKFAVLPTPKYSRADVGENSRTTVVATMNMSMFIHKNVEKRANKQAVIDFFAYFNKAENMDLQHKESASMRPFEYELDADVSANMSHLLKNYHELMSGDRTDVVFMVDNNDFVRANGSKMEKNYWVFYSQFRSNSDEKSYMSIKTFKDNPSITAEDYFEGFYRAYTYKANAGAQSLWEQMLDKIK